MKLKKIRVRNYRSIVDSGDFRVESFLALVGENNAGKSNLLYALNVFLTSGAGGIQESDFFDINNLILITATFGDIQHQERKRLRPYLLGDELILEKQISIQEDPRSGKPKPKAEYHGYMAKPKDWWLSTEGVTEHENTPRPNWEKIAKEHGIYDYVKDDRGKVNKKSYESGINQILLERDDIQFEEPKPGETQALGFQSVLIDALPSFHILPAITDYSDEIDKRSKNTNFRMLMGNLADRIIKNDPRYQQIETTLRNMRELLNAPAEGEKREEGQNRLVVLGEIENKLKEIIANLMPSVREIKLEVHVDEVKDVFSRGVAISVDDGKLTDVMTKGHGLQRCIVFGLLQALILNQRGKLIPEEGNTPDATQLSDKTIILAIEEPELYIHPQMQRLIYGVLKDFSQSDQVVYTTHSPAFVDLGRYESLAIVRKESVTEGTKINQCEAGVFGSLEERKGFQFITSFGIEKNHLFFAKKVILVEGQQDIIAILATGRNLKLFKEFPEELGVTLIDTDGKEQAPKYLKLLNEFKIPYIILHELDGKPDDNLNKEIKELLGGNPSVELPYNLEQAVDHNGHFKPVYSVKKYFEDPKNITEYFGEKVKELFQQLGVQTGNR